MFQVVISAASVADVCHELTRTGVRVHALALLPDRTQLILSQHDLSRLERRLSVERAERLHPEHHADAILAVDLAAYSYGLVRRPIDHPASTYAIHAGEPARAAALVPLWSPSPWFLSLGASFHERAASFIAAADDRRRLQRKRLERAASARNPRTEVACGIDPEPDAESEP